MGSVSGTAKHKAILFVSHEDSTGHASLRYRSNHHEESLRFLGVSCDVAAYGTVDVLAAVEVYSCIVLHRMPWSAAAPLVERARELGRMVVTEIDDLVFEPATSQHVEAIDELTDGERTDWTETFRRTLEAGDGAIVATEGLAEYARPLSNPVEIVANVVSEEMIRLADRARLPRALAKRNKSDDEGVTIAYFSGSPTHQDDFEQVAGTVAWALETYPHVHFAIVGLHELDSRFEPFAARVERVPFRHWPLLPDLVAQTDVNLAPLARNPFSECKSCVKYLEAALLEVPTIASPRRDFVRAIEHGRNGLLAETAQDWQEALRLLIEDPDLRRELGRQARVDVHRRHTTLSRLPAIEEAWRSLARPHTNPDEPLTVAWLVGAERGESPEELRTVLGLASSLAEKGHRVRVYGRNVRRYESSTVTVEEGFDTIEPADVGIATDTTTAYLLVEQPNVLFKTRFVQRLGEIGYELPLRHIALGSTVAARVSEPTRRPADSLEPALDPGAELERLLRDVCFLRLPP